MTIKLKYNLSMMEDGEVTDIKNQAFQMKPKEMAGHTNIFSESIVVTWDDIKQAEAFYQWVVANAAKYWEKPLQVVEESYKPLFHPFGKFTQVH